MKTALLMGTLLWPLVAAEPVSVSAILGRPTSRSITASVLASKRVEVYIEYGTRPGTYTAKSAMRTLEGGKPAEVPIDGLNAGAAYSYRLRYREPGTAEFAASEQAGFHTARPAGAAFTFAVQADPHLDDATDAEVYRRTLRHERQSGADFLIDLGDTFMSEKLENKSAVEIERRHLLARSYFALVADAMPLYLVLGNHEGEGGRHLDGTSNSLAVLATLARKRYFPNPEPDRFYTGSTRVEPFVGRRQNYYAWSWGDALLLTLDPFWYTTGRASPGGGNWHWTLGREQYDWLKVTLEQSRARYKFVFIHNLVGGVDLDGRARGGIEAAPYFEWGGHNQDGTWGFDQKRPGWAMPIHHLLVRNNVTAVFHGHDHMYAKQDLDGIVYQDVPQPGAGRARNPRGQYGYTNGEILGGAGYMQVHVAPEGVKAELIRTNPGAGEVAHSYTIAPRARNDSQSATTTAGSRVAPAPPPSQQRDRKDGKKGGGRGLGKQP